ncbi:hypothetical protein ACF0H5_020572 [Mactra antiquata]
MSTNSTMSKSKFTTGNLSDLQFGTNAHDYISYRKATYLLEALKQRQHKKASTYQNCIIIATNTEMYYFYSQMHRDVSVRKNCVLNKSKTTLIGLAILNFKGEIQ